MSDIALTNRNPKNGRYGLPWDATGKDVVFDDTLEHEVMTRLCEHRAKWLGDPDGTQGSRFYTLKEGSSQASLHSDADAYAREALKPMTDTNLITVDMVLVDAPSGRGRVDVTVFYTPRGGKQQQTKVSL